MPIPTGIYGQQQHQQTPTCLERMKMGFKMGFLVGMASTALLGGIQGMRLGLRGRDLINNVGKLMLQGGGSFGTFMAIGVGLRC